MKTIEETMSIIHLENNHRKINKLEDIEILKAASSKYCSMMSSQNKMYKPLPSSVILTPRSTAQKLKIEKYGDDSLSIEHKYLP